MRIHSFAAVLLASALGSSAAFAQVAEKANTGYKTKQDRARVARNLDNPDRVDRQKPVELLESIGVEPGETIADIGTGVGFMLPYMIDAVGPSGRVYAEDIQDDFLEKVKQKTTEHGWNNVEIVKGAQKDVELPENSVDLAFIPRCLSSPQLPRRDDGDGLRSRETGWQAGRDRFLPQPRASAHVRGAPQKTISALTATVSGKRSSRSVSISTAPSITFPISTCSCSGSDGP